MTIKGHSILTICDESHASLLVHHSNDPFLLSFIQSCFPLPLVPKLGSSPGGTNPAPVSVLFLAEVDGLHTIIPSPQIKTSVSLPTTVRVLLEEQPGAPSIT